MTNYLAFSLAVITLVLEAVIASPLAQRMYTVQRRYVGLETMHRNTKRSIFDSGKGLSIGIAVVIIIGVVLGLLAVSIAVFGFEWRKYFGKQYARQDLEVNTRMLDSEVALAHESRHPSGRGQ